MPSKPSLIPATILRKIARMRYKMLTQICLLIVLSLFLAACPAAKKSEHSPTRAHSQSWHLPNWLHFGKSKTVWGAMLGHYRFTKNNDRPAVKSEIRWYLKRPRYIKALMKNAKPYLYYVYQQTKKRGMPAEVALLPMIESNYNPFQFSKKGAVGLWQMMPGTASGTGVKINWWYDGRRDIIASTRAALDYLTYMHDYFNNWLLAIAAYDSGLGTVEDAILHNKKLHKPTDFWSLPLPTETKKYIPKLLALASVFANPTKYHIKLNSIPNHPFFKAIDMSGQLNFQQIAKLSHVPIKQIRMLNPGFRRWATTPKGNYSILLPEDKAIVFQTKMANYKKPSPWIRHKVVLGESLSQLAKRYHIRVSSIKRANHLKSNVIIAGQHLLVPRNNHQKLPRKIALHRYISEDHVPGPKRLVHVVSTKDTLSKIAAHHHVSTAELRYWNNLTYHQKIHPKQKIIIWRKPPHHRTKRYRYKVKSGDSLSVIAARFGVTMKSIKQANHSSLKMIRTGQYLTILKG